MIGKLTLLLLLFHLNKSTTFIQLALKLFPLCLHLNRETELRHEMRKQMILFPDCHMCKKTEKARTFVTQLHDGL